MRKAAWVAEGCTCLALKAGALAAGRDLQVTGMWMFSDDRGQTGHPRRTCSQRSRRDGEGAWTQTGWTWELKKRWAHGSKGTSFWLRCCLCSAQLQPGVTQEVTPGSLQTGKRQENCLGPQGREGRHSGRRPSISSLTEERNLPFSTPRRAPEPAQVTH